MATIFVCQVCGRESVPDESDEELWCVQNLNFRSGTIVVLTCPDCAELDREKIFEGFKRRILDGHDLNYH